MSTDTINKYNKIKEFVPMNSQTRNKLEDLVGTIKDNMSWMKQFKSDSENIERILSNNIDKSSDFYKKIESIDNDISKGLPGLPAILVVEMLGIFSRYLRLKKTVFRIAEYRDSLWKEFV